MKRKILKGKKRVVRYVAVIMAALMLISLGADKEFAFASNGEDDISSEAEISGELVTVRDIDLPDSDQLLQQYIENDAFGYMAQIPAKPLLKAPRKNRLNIIEQHAYDDIKTKVLKIANGETNDGRIYNILVTEDMIRGNSFTAADLGVETLGTQTSSGFRLSEEAKAALFDVSKVIKALMLDCPYEFYWFDKTETILSTSESVGGYQYYYPQITAEYDPDTDSITVKQARSTGILFYVSANYSLSGEVGTFELDVTKTKAAAGVAENAADVVADAASMTDLQKVNYYREWICSQVAYNRIASNGQTAYGDPWQLIYVFDNDSSTDVVCEGYAKAFKLLCDLTDFESNSVECHIVEGTLNGGDHMWNLLTMDDGRNYLADVTNCDYGMIGYPDKLFLKGDPSGNSSRYTIRIGSDNASYIYSGLDQIYQDDERIISKCDYDSHTFTEGETVAGTCINDGYTVYVCSVCGLEKTETIPGSPGGHVWGEWTSITEATCSNEGEEQRVCQLDSSHTETRKTNIDPDAHQWGEWKVIKPVTETEEGIEERVCILNASHTERRAIQIEEHKHSMVHVEAKTASCEETGNISYWICTGGSSSCGKYFLDEAGENQINESDTVIPAKGHDWGDAEYIWSDDNTAVTGIRRCKNDPSHTEEISVSCSVEEIKETDTLPPGIKYTASFDKEGYKDQEKIIYIPIDISGASIEDIPDKTYTGDPFEPEVTVSLDGKTLTKDKDYTLSYSDNINVGNGIITVNGIGKYSGQAVKRFRISSYITMPKTASVGTVNAGKFKKTLTLTPTVRSNDTSITWSSSDISIATVNNRGVVTGVSDKGVSAAKVTITATTKDGIKASCTVTVEDPVSAFIRRLYRTCLSRNPDAGGFKNWYERLTNKTFTGARAAYNFFFSPEFKKKNYCDDHYVTYLYNAILGRSPDSGGKASKIKLLESGRTREEIFNGFVVSAEFGNLCGQYGIERGDKVGVPEYGTAIQTGPCSACGKEDQIMAFVRRLYNVCLDRAPDTGGLAKKTMQLKRKTQTARQIAAGFYFSAEFGKKYPENREFIIRCYRGMLGRTPSESEIRKKLNDMKTQSKTQIFNGFANSAEFGKICARYGINAK